MGDKHLEHDELLKELHALRGEVRQLQAKVAQDATASVREALLVEAERIAHLGSWMWDLRSQQVFWSDEFFRILGLDPAVDTATAEGFFGAIHPQDRARVDELTERSLHSGVVAKIEFRVIRKNGDVRDLLMNGAFLFDDEGNILRMVGCCLDTTEYNRTQEEVRRFEAMLGIMETLTGVGVFHWSSSEGEKAHWSKEMYRIFGQSKPLTAQEFLGHVVQEDRAFAAAMRVRLHEEGNVGPMALRIRRDGEIRHLILNAKLLNSQGDIGGSIVDITEKIEDESRIRQSQKMEALGRLAGGVAHDFNNLLTVIVGNASMIVDEVKDPQLVEEILGASAQAETLTRQLLSFSRDAVVEHAPTNLNEVTRAALVLIRRVVGDGAEVEFLPGEGLWQIEADSGQLNQVLMNLAVNARDALSLGGKIWFSTRNVPADAGSALPGMDSVELQVADNGRGMADAEIRRAFEPFFTTKAAQGGTGFGLATVYSIIGQHRGSIAVHSELGKGTTLVMHFPRRR